MYVLDFFKNLFHRNKIAVMIYLLLNYIFIFSFFGGFVLFIPEAWSDGSWIWGLLVLLIYPISLCITLSPIGEAILRTSQGCKNISGTEYASRLEPLFYEVYKKAKENSSNLPDGIKIFISDDDEVNAFATGRQTVCITKGFLNNYTDAQIKGALAHEFGHLAHNDTDVTLAVAIGNVIVTVIFYIIYFIAIIFNSALTVVADEEGGWGWLFEINNKLMALGFGLFMWLWSKIGLMICNISNRRQEYDADKFALECGYGDELHSVISSFGKAKSKQGLFSALMSSHPKNENRLAELEKYGADLKNKQRKNGMMSCDRKINKVSISQTKLRQGESIIVSRNQSASTVVNTQISNASNSQMSSNLTGNDASLKPSFCPYCGAKALGKFCGKCGNRIPEYAIDTTSEISIPVNCAVPSVNNNLVNDSHKISNEANVSTDNHDMSDNDEVLFDDSDVTCEISSTKDVYAPNLIFSVSDAKGEVSTHKQEKSVKDDLSSMVCFSKDDVAYTSANSMAAVSSTASAYEEETEDTGRIIIFDDENDGDDVAYTSANSMAAVSSTVSAYEEETVDTGRIIIFDDDE